MVLRKCREQKGALMKRHANARTCSHCRSLIVSRVTDDGETSRAVATAFRVSERTVRKWLKRFHAEGPTGLTDRSCRPHRIARRYLQPGKELHDAVFALLHTPPNDHGFNRTTWKLSELRNTLRAQGAISTQRSISAVIKSAGYRWKHARVTLTSTDPDYRGPPTSPTGLIDPRSPPRAPMHCRIRGRCTSSRQACSEQATCLRKIAAESNVFEGS